MDGGRSPRPRPRTSSIIVRPWYAGTSDELKGVARVMRRAMTDDMWAAGAAACVQATVHACMHGEVVVMHACVHHADAQEDTGTPFLGFSYRQQQRTERKMPCKFAV